MKTSMKFIIIGFVTLFMSIPIIVFVDISPFVAIIPLYFIGHIFLQVAWYYRAKENFLERGF